MSPYTKSIENHGFKVKQIKSTNSKISAANRIMRKDSTKKSDSEFKADASTQPPFTENDHEQLDVASTSRSNAYVTLDNNLMMQHYKTQASLQSNMKEDDNQLEPQTDSKVKLPKHLKNRRLKSRKKQDEANTTSSASQAISKVNSFRLIDTSQIALKNKQQRNAALSGLEAHNKNSLAAQMPANFYKTANVESSEALMKKTHSSDINDSKRQDTKLTDHIKNDSIQIFKETEVVDSS